MPKVPSIISGERGNSGKGYFARSNRSGIAEFRYHFNGTIGGNDFSYKVVKKDGNVTFSCESMERPELGEVTKPENDALLDRLNEIYLKYRVAGWDGFSKYNQYVCDGSGFSLSIKFNDGSSLRADGTNAFPPRYREFCDAMSALLDPIRDEMI